MVQPAKNFQEGSMEKWIEFCENLLPSQNLSLIGLITLRPGVTPSIIAVGNLADDENKTAAEKWLYKNLRKAFNLYCAHYKKSFFQLAGIAVDKSGFVKNLAPVVVASFNVPIGIAVAFLFAAISMGLGNWCERYGKKEYAGKGEYLVKAPRLREIGYFEIIYQPAIVKYVEDPAAYPIGSSRIKVEAPAEIDGKVKVTTSERSLDIFTSFKQGSVHLFGFQDDKAKMVVNGIITSVRQEVKEGPNILGFSSDEIEILPFESGISFPSWPWKGNATRSSLATATAAVQKKRLVYSAEPGGRNLMDAFEEAVAKNRSRGKRGGRRGPKKQRKR